MMRWPYPFWFAHRGAGPLAPENTLAAFKVGVAQGFRAFECDVKLSADGVPFLMHDAHLDRTTSGSGLASRLSFRELSRLDAGSWHGPAFAGEPVPSLEAVAQYCISERLALNIEIKPMPGAEAETGRVVATAAALWWAHAPVLPLLSSFQAASLAAARTAAPHLPRALLVDNLRPRWIEEALGLGCDAIVAAYRLMGGPQIHAVHRAGLRALCYTVDDEQDIERLRLCGVDGLITDAVDTIDPA